MEGFHRSAVGGGEGQPAVGRPAGDRVLGVSPAALAGATGGPEACGRGGPAPGAEAAAHLCPARQLPILHGGLPAAPAAGAAGRGRLSAGAQLCAAGAQGECVWGTGEGTALLIDALIFFRVRRLEYLNDYHFTTCTNRQLLEMGGAVALPAAT